MSDSRPVIMQCENCDKDMREGDRMRGTITGTVDVEVDGFMGDGGAWSDVICTECGDAADTRPDVTRQLLKAAQDAEYLLVTGGPDMDMNDVIAGLQAAMARAKGGGITL